MKLSEQFKRMAELAEAQEVGEPLYYLGRPAELNGHNNAHFANDWTIGPPEPKRIWVNYHSSGWDSTAHSSEQRACHSAGPKVIRKAVPYIELTPEVAEKLGIDDV